MSEGTRVGEARSIPSHPNLGTPEAVYEYLDGQEDLRFVVCRFAEKQFRQGRPNGAGWIWNLDGVDPLLYRLPRLLAHFDSESRAPIYVCEGEKDVDAVANAGAVATCNSGGARKWRDEHTTAILAARRIIIVADRDPVGLEHARIVHTNLGSHGYAGTIEVVEALDGKDASDHLASGYSLDEFQPVELLTEALHSWQPINLGASPIVAQEPPRIGGIAYPGRRHLLSGETESLKTWGALVLELGEMEAGNSVLHIDFEMGHALVRERLLALGASEEMLRRRYFYLQPTEPLEHERVDHVQTFIAHHRPTLVVVDASIGAMELHGLDPNNGADVERFYRLLAPLQGSSAALMVIDHVAKNRTNHGKYAVGSERKVSAVDVHLRFKATKTFGRGQTGYASIHVMKDRLGQLPRGKAAELRLVSDGETGRIVHELTVIGEPAADNTKNQRQILARPEVMESVSSYLEAIRRPASRNEIEKTKSVRGGRAAIGSAIDRLCDEGYASESSGERGARMTTFVKRFAPAGDGTSSQLVPPRPDVVSDEHVDLVQPRPTPIGGTRW